MATNTILSLKKNTTKTIEVELNLCGSDLEKLFKGFILQLVPEAEEFGDNISLDFHVDVPGGGDYSNMRLDINEHQKLLVKLKGIKNID